MGIIPCPECKKNISETAANCPKCGYVLTPEKIAEIKKKQKELQKKAGIGCLSLIGIIVLISVFSSHKNNIGSKQQVQSANTQHVSVKDQIAQALGSSNRNVPKISHIAATDSIIVNFSINDNIIEKLIKFGAKHDVEKILKTVQTSGYHYDEIRLMGTFPLVDKFGKSAEVKVLQLSYKRATVNRINWEGFLTDNIYDIADSIWLHPAFR